MSHTVNFPEPVDGYIKILWQDLEHQEPSEIGDLTGYKVKVEYYALKELLFWLRQKGGELAVLQEVIDRLRSLPGSSR